LILSDKTIKRMLDSGELSIEPIIAEQIGPASVDLRLGNTFLTPRATNGVCSMSEAPEYEEVTADEFVVPTRGFVLATTVEVIRVPNNLTAFVEGRSSIGRRGLFIQNNSQGILFIKLGVGVLSTSFTVRINRQGFYEAQWPNFTGIVTGVWSTAGAGDAQITETF